jgi:phage/plasmid-associated DNA primase
MSTSNKNFEHNISIVNTNIDNIDSDNSDYEDYQNDYCAANDDTMVTHEYNEECDKVLYELSTTSTENIIQRKISKNMRDLDNFLRNSKYIVEKGDPNTNIISVLERKCYNIPINDLGTFFEKLDNCRREKMLLHYAERQYNSAITHSGIHIDFDRYQATNKDQLTEQHFSTLAHIILGMLHNYIGFSNQKVHCFITRKPGILPAPTKTGQMRYKDGFHLLVPEIMVSKGLKKYLLNEILEKKLLSTVFADIDNLEPAESMLDMASSSNPMHFYGNSKVGKQPYVLQYAYRCTYYPMGIIGPTMMNVPIESLLEYNLAYELSLCHILPEVGGKETLLKKAHYNYLPALETPIQLMVEKSQHGIIPHDEIIATENSVDLLTLTDPEAKYIKQLLDILDESYANDYDKWFMVVCAIANVSSRYKDLAIHFSQRKPEAWSQDELDRVWNEALSKVHPRPVTKRSIIHWAKTSSPVRFREIQGETYTHLLRNYVFENEGRVEHAMVATILQRMIGEKFVVDCETPDSNEKKNYRWYEFVIDGQSMRKGEIYKWRREADPDNIHLYIADHVSKLYNQVMQEVKQRKDDSKSDPEMKYWDKVEKAFKLYKSRLSENTFQVGVIKQAQYRFRVRGFIDELDSYENILGVGNGILILGQNAQLVRGFHEYRISKYTETDYVPYDPNNRYVKELLRIIHEIFPEEDVFQFMLFHASTWLDACDPACMLLLLVGGGQNGKSFFLRMVHNALGNRYVGCGKIALLSSPNERAESANSAQMQLKDKRGFYFEEANKCEVLNSSRIKTITSPGYQSGRDLHQRQENFRNTANVICASNYDYIIDCTDHGTWRRILYYKNKVKFCANPDPTNQYEKKEDPNIMRVYPNDVNYKQAMLSILVHYNEILRSKYNGDLKRIPIPTIDAETYQFRRRQDVIHRFITEMIVVSPKSEPISLHTIATKYTSWYGNIVKNASPTVTEVISQLENSCLARSLERRSSTVLFLIGHRLKMSPDEPLEEGESEIVPSATEPQKNTQSSAQNGAYNDINGGQDVAIAATEAPELPSDNQYKFIEDLEKNTPTYLQSRDEEERKALANMTINLDELLGINTVV